MRFDDVPPWECYFCGAPATENLCWECARHHTRQEIAAKKLIASILKGNQK